MMDGYGSRPESPAGAVEHDGIGAVGQLPADGVAGLDALVAQTPGHRGDPLVERGARPPPSRIDDQVVAARLREFEIYGAQRAPTDARTVLLFIWLSL
jgi:hypothetical protein